MILCVNPNAAIDKTLVVENFHLNAIQRPVIELSLPGGKGCNVARVAKTLGQQPVVAGWVGGFHGQFIEAGLRDEGIQTALVHTAAESRDCTSILDSANGTITEIYEKGRPVTPEELDQFYHLFQEWLPRVQVVTLSGSLPPGVPVDFYAILIGLAHKTGVRVMLDSSGEPLRIGLEDGRPDLLKCNRAELSEATGQLMETLEDIRRLAGDLAARLGGQVVVTLGEVGAVAADRQRTWIIQAPRVKVVSAVGSGDAFLAGLACGILEGRPFEASLRLATAAGSANAMRIGAGVLRVEDVDALSNQVVVA